MSRDAQSLLCSLASGWAVHAGGCNAHFLGHPGGITACAPGEAPGCFGLGQRFGETFANPGDRPPLGSGMCHSVAVPGRYTGQTFLRVRQAGSLWILSSLLFIPGWEMAETSRAPVEGPTCAARGEFVPKSWAW